MTQPQMLVDRKQLLNFYVFIAFNGSNIVVPKARKCEEVLVLFNIGDTPLKALQQFYDKCVLHGL